MKQSEFWKSSCIDALQDFLRHFYCLSKAYRSSFYNSLFMHSCFIRLYTCDFKFYNYNTQNSYMNRNKNRLWISIYLGFWGLEIGSALSMLCIMGVNLFYRGAMGACLFHESVKLNREIGQERANTYMI